MNLSEVGKDFISKCIEVEATKRLSAELALHHPWISQSRVGNNNSDVVALPGKNKRKRDGEAIEVQKVKHTKLN